ncbi:MAG: amidohydrolase family protein [Rhodopseudomonas palustris]|nr:amidohydrolase family protein [Rhodopseudomonas palustris]
MFFDKQIKLFADGAIISQLMQMKDGYLDGHKGEWIIPPDQLEQRMRLFWNAGYQIHIHVNGDLGLEVLLGIIEKLMTENPRQDHRTVIVHFANSSEDQVARIARLRRDRQRQSVLSGRLCRQIRQGRSWPGAG